MLRGFLLIMLPFLVTACCKGKCLDNFIHVNYIGFRNTDIDTIIVRAFEKGSRFSVSVDTQVHYLQEPPYDTLFSYIPDAPAFRDYQIIIPSTLDTFRVENISTRRRDCNCGSDWNEVASFTLDGVRVDSNIVVLRR